MAGWQQFFLTFNSGLSQVACLHENWEELKLLKNKNDALEEISGNV